MLESIYIRNLIEDDSEIIVDLIKRIYGNYYFEEEYYDAQYIKNKLKERHTYWKGAFLNDILIGQMLFTLEHNAAYLKLTMVEPEYQGKGVITQLGIEMMKIKDLMNSSVFKCVYAIINEDNVPIIKILNNFNFKYLGRIPNHDNNKGLKIFGLILYDFNWKLIKPHLKIGPSIYKSIKSAGIKRMISASNFTKEYEVLSTNKLKMIRSKNNYERTNVIQISNTSGEQIAELIENRYQKSWYDVKFLRHNLDPISKKKVISFLLKEYSSDTSINSISFPLLINDIVSQNILLNLGAKYYAYLPFYYKDFDSILLGFSKIERGGVIPN